MVRSRLKHMYSVLFAPSYVADSTWVVFGMNRAPNETLAHPGRFATLAC